MKLRHLEVFWAVMSTGSVSDAARLLHVSVPAVSRVLGHLEVQLGFPLFDRIKGRLYPTEESKRLFKSVDDIYGRIRDIDRLAQDLLQRRKGLLSIVASNSIGHELVPIALAKLRLRFPDLHVRFVLLGHEALRDCILEGHADLGISTLPMEHPQLTTRLIARSELMCICPWSHPLAQASAVSAQELAQHLNIGYVPKTPMAQRLASFFDQHGSALQTTIEVGTPHSACALVQAGAGVALVEQFSLQSWPRAAFRVIPLEGATPILADLIYLRGAPLSRPADVFVEYLTEVLDIRALIPNAPKLSMQMLLD
ncbi:LysR family transcriptional regulator [Corticibacter populi]|uniref:LysR family transcriptional regulator n=1 Tax=Corticibacter populi TaxID=1550736 RepID=A0A3M6QS17_9BURK|nr:LysR family transcriptional regulator [Corticibacter populi]RMX05824.1 LysR family transcriptional regulator [Corticibacter populi]RZS30862.1 DNA-binding transcriptional LysR family regulator [Corticibacter populi]